MFKAVLKNTALFRDSIETIAELIDEATFKIDQNGISMIAVDRAVVAVVLFQLRSDAFEKFHIEKPAEIGLNMLNLVPIVRRIKPEDRLHIEFDAKNKLNLTLKGSSTRSFSVPIIDIPKEEGENYSQTISQLAFPLDIELRSDVIREGINDADGVGADSVIFKADGNFFGMLAEGDSSVAELKIGKEEDTTLKITGKDFVKSRFPIEYLRKIVKAAKISPLVHVKLNNDYPMRMEFNTEKANLTFIVAPRVED